MKLSAHMATLHSLLPDLAATETRVVTITAWGMGIKPGEYAFLELYCTDKKCDCRRVMIQVRDSSSNLYATLSYGWEKLQFYVDWMHGDIATASEIPGVNLYELQPQSEYAEKFLDLYKGMMEDKTLSARYQRHYWQFKAALGNGVKSGAKSAAAISELRKKNRRFLRKPQQQLQLSGKQNEKHV